MLALELARTAEQLGPAAEAASMEVVAAVKQPVAAA